MQAAENTNLSGARDLPFLENLIINPRWETSAMLVATGQNQMQEKSMFLMNYCAID